MLTPQRKRPPSMADDRLQMLRDQMDAQGAGGPAPRPNRTVAPQATRRFVPTSSFQNAASAQMANAAATQGQPMPMRQPQPAPSQGGGGLSDAERAAAIERAKAKIQAKQDAGETYDPAHADERDFIEQLTADPLNVDTSEDEAFIRQQMEQQMARQLRENAARMGAAGMHLSGADAR